MSVDRAELPIACSLDVAEGSDRRAVWERLSQRALREQRQIPDGMQLVFAAREGVEEQLHELAELEAECCSFADWKVERRDADVVLEITAPPDAVAAVRALFV